MLKLFCDQRKMTILVHFEMDSKHLKWSNLHKNMFQFKLMFKKISTKLYLSISEMLWKWSNFTKKHKSRTLRHRKIYFAYISH